MLKGKADTRKIVWVRSDVNMGKSTVLTYFKTTTNTVLTLTPYTSYKDYASMRRNEHRIIVFDTPKDFVWSK